MPDSINGIKVLDKIPEVIKLNHVYFRYPNCDDYVMKDICLEIRKGESLVLVGENGSGKSTLIKLLLVPCVN